MSVQATEVIVSFSFFRSNKSLWYFKFNQT